MFACWSSGILFININLCWNHRKSVRIFITLNESALLSCWLLNNQIWLWLNNLLLVCNELMLQWVKRTTNSKSSEKHSHHWAPQSSCEHTQRRLIWASALVALPVFGQRTQKSQQQKKRSSFCQWPSTKQRIDQRSLILYQTHTI